MEEEEETDDVEEARPSFNKNKKNTAAKKDILDETSEAEEETDDVKEASSPNFENDEDMWKHFIRNETKGTAKCKFCSNILMCSRPQNLSVHLKNKHQIELNKNKNKNKNENKNNSQKEEVTATTVMKQKMDGKNIASVKKAPTSYVSSKGPKVSQNLKKCNFII